MVIYGDRAAASRAESPTSCPPNPPASNRPHFLPLPLTVVCSFRVHLTNQAASLRPHFVPVPLQTGAQLQMISSRRRSSIIISSSSRSSNISSRSIISTSISSSSSNITSSLVSNPLLYHQLRHSLQYRTCAGSLHYVSRHIEGFKQNDVCTRLR